MEKLLFALLSISLLIACRSDQVENNVEFEKAISSVDELVAHSAEFDTPQVIEVTDGIHVAIGFGLSNSILIEGENGNIIVDCTESDDVATKVKAEFNKISDQPVKALIYTHNHADHIFGAGVMAGGDNPEVYSHELTNYYIDRILNIVQPIITSRSFRMFGNHLDEESHINCGIGPYLDSDETTNRSLVRPTKTFRDELEVEIEGVKIQLAHVPGETDDQLYVWLPERKVLLPGDNIYKTFPNLYTIRGTPYRDVKKWANSLDKMRYLQPEFLIPSHTQPITGADTIQSILRDYADAIRFVHDQTIRYMNKGLMPDEIAEKVILPEHLSSSPFLKEFYGRVDWSVKNIFNGYLGWFDGNPTTLLPLPLKEKAEKMAQLAGGQDQLLKNAENAVTEESYQWALELTDYLLRLNPDEEKIKTIRYDCLIALGEKQSNPNARNYYLTKALEIKNGGEIPLNVKRGKAMVHNIPLEAIFNGMTVKTVPQKCINYNKKAVFHFTDSGERWTVHIRNGITEVQAFALENPDLTITTKSTVWKEVVAKLRNPLIAITTGALKIEGGSKQFKEFMGMFSDEDAS